MRAEFLPVLIVFIVIGIPVICGTLLALAKIMRGGDNSRNGIPSKHQAEETELIQEIHRGLTRLENRIEALETIVISNEPKKSSSTTSQP